MARRRIRRAVNNRALSWRLNESGKWTNIDSHARRPPQPRKLSFSRSSCSERFCGRQQDRNNNRSESITSLAPAPATISGFEWAHFLFGVSSVVGRRPSVCQSAGEPVAGASQIDISGRRH